MTTLNDQQVSDSIHILVKKYLELNGVVNPTHISFKRNDNNPYWVIDVQQWPYNNITIPTYDLLRVIDLAEIIRAERKNEIIYNTFSNPDENDIKFAKMTKFMFRMFMTLLTDPPQTKITNAQALAYLSNQSGISENLLLKFMQNNKI